MSSSQPVPSLRSPVLPEPVPGPPSPVFLGPVPSLPLEQVRLYRLAQGYLDRIRDLSDHLPPTDRYGLRDHIRRTAASMVQQVNESASRNTGFEQGRLISLAVSSCFEIIGCLNVGLSLGYLSDLHAADAEESGCSLLDQLRSLRQRLQDQQTFPEQQR